MANLVNLESVHKSYGVQPLLDGVSLGVGDTDRIGVVGLNGGGKTTLLELLAGIVPPDDGRISRHATCASPWSPNGPNWTMRLPCGRP